MVIKKHLEDKLNNREFVVTVELDPPKSAVADKVCEQARQLVEWVDAVNIVDCPMANLRMSPIALAHIIQSDVGMETIFHLTCRERNLIGLQSELLGAAGLGVRNILTLTGDRPTSGDHPYAKGVFETDSTGLIRLAAQLNAGQDDAGNALEASPSFFIGTAANPTASDWPAELDKLEQKVAAGARFLQTQPVYDADAARLFLERIAHLPVYPIIGVLPLRGHKMARYLNEKVTGIVVPEPLIKAVEAGGKAAGFAAAHALVEELSTFAPGVHLMPLNDIEAASALAKAAKNATR